MFAANRMETMQVFQMFEKKETMEPIKNLFREKERKFIKFWKVRKQF